MARQKVKKTRKPGWKKRASYEKNDMDSAIKAVKRGTLSIRAAAKFFEVPRSTLQDILNNTHGRLDGRKPELNRVEEERLAMHVEICGQWGFPFSFSDLCHMVKSYLDTKGTVSTRFKNNLPTRRWVACFLKRHPRLTMRTANPIKRARSQVSKDEVVKFVGNWEKEIQGVPESNIFNYDETNLRYGISTGS